ncbi:MAG: heterodisulfide reductase-related iron-sulfur binding cluster [Candidatus Hermodarchaeota archaeon]
MKEDYKCPCRDIDPDHFIENDEVVKLIETKKDYKFTEEDFLRLYNCVHCNDCGTAEERFILKEKYLKDGNSIEGLDETISIFEEFGTPYKYNKNRIKPIDGIIEESTTLLYLGCFTTVKTPKYGENVIKYLLREKIDFCIIKEELCCGYPILCTGKIDVYNKFAEKNLKLFEERGFKKIITACPSCYMVFKKHYSVHGIEVKYFTEYLKPPKVKKKGNLIIQHACPLKNGEIPNVADYIEQLYKESGYNVLIDVPRDCCGFGVGHQLRIDVWEAIANKRMQDFKKESGYLNKLIEGDSYITSYCPDAFHVLKNYGRKARIKFKMRDMCDLLL